MIDSPQRSVGSDLEKASPEVAARFSRLVRDLVWELHPEMQRRVAVTLDSDLDRDLGLDSLGRAELVKDGSSVWQLSAEGALFGYHTLAETLYAADSRRP